MREIKFRAWDKADGFNNDFGSMSYGVRHDCDATEIMQYTGLKDKNGVEIYEGDLLNVFYENNGYNHDLLMRVFCNPSRGTLLTFVRLFWESFAHNQYPMLTNLSLAWGEGLRNIEGKLEIYHHEHCTSTSRFIEVIGNIHENRDLLESE